nr:uncharacterized protein LOC129434466 [Misgurnus anguillicaudatus]
MEHALLYTLFRMQSKRRRRNFLRRLRHKKQHLLFAAFSLAAAVHFRTERHTWVKVRSQHWWEDIVLASFTEQDWVSSFRMGRRTFAYLCVSLKSRIIKRDTHLRQAIPIQKRVAVALWYLATGSGYNTISHLFGLSRSSVCVCVWEVCSAMVSCMQKHIQLPTGQRLLDIMDGFERLWGFPQCAGAIDGSHIPITAPQLYAKDYFNRKGHHSIILQALVDYQSQFTNINVGWAGSVHDARVLRNSSIFDLAERGVLFPEHTRSIAGIDVPITVLGDAAYPLMPWLMKPYSDHGQLMGDQQHFNYRLSRARMTVECAFGRLKGRWRCLLKQSELELKRVPVVVTACCILHNLCEQNGETFDNEWLQGQSESGTLEETQEMAPVLQQQQQQQPHAHNIRMAFTKFFSEQGRQQQ